MAFFDHEVAQVFGHLNNFAQAPQLVLLEGPLGIGKTTFTKELLAQLGVDPKDVPSPTFLKLIEHQIPKHGLCLHLDCYRMEDANELDVMALQSYENATLWIVEWPKLFLAWLKINPGIKKFLNFRKAICLNFEPSRKIVIELSDVF